VFVVRWIEELALAPHLLVLPVSGALLMDTDSLVGHEAVLRVTPRRVSGLRARLETPVYQSPVRARRRDMVMIMAMWTMASWCSGRVS
jgi:hypothetical protein